MRLVPLSVALVFALVACDRGPEDDSDTDVETDTDTDTDSDSDTDTDTDTDTDADITPCDPPTSMYYGVLQESQITDVAPTGDAGIAAVVAAAPAGDGETATVDLQITNATVMMVGYRPSGGDLWSLWVQDENAAIRTYASSTPITAEVVPGNKVSFKVTEIKNYAGELEITKLADFVVDDTTAGPVYVQDVTGETITYADHGREVVYTYGRITTVPAACGGSSVCATWLLPTGQEVDFRIGEQKGVVQGDCIQVVSPVGTFDGDVQFDINDFDWVEFF
jgi:hypothetical protein